MAWAGKSPTKFNKGKFDILGIMNETRGTDSCGVTVDGDIRIGVQDNKAYRAFLANVDYNRPKEIPVVIGHTRKSTSGANNMDNAHPFGYGTNAEKYLFVGVHNGSLHNQKELAEKNDVSVTAPVPYKDYTGVRTKIDSEILLEIIYKNKDFKVLSKYEGAAALLFTNINEPNIIYAYHGASIKEKYDNPDKLFIERPLFYYRENKHSLYISSQEEALAAIGGDEKTIGEFNCNIIYKITDGDIHSAEKFVISRRDSFQNKYVAPRVLSTPNRKKQFVFDEMEGNEHGSGIENGRDDYGYGGFHPGSRSVGPNPNTYPSTAKTGPDKNNIYNDTCLYSRKAYGARIYMNQLRYWRTGHRIDGCFTWIAGWGFLQLSQDVEKAEEIFLSFLNKYFYEGYFTDEPPEGQVKFIPFPSGGNDPQIKDVSEYIHFFIDGVRIRTVLDYSAAVRLASRNMEFDWDSLSMAAKHPIIDIDLRYSENKSQNILQDGELFTGVICPLGAEKKYTIIDGNCIRIEPVVIEMTTLVEVSKLLEQEEKEIMKADTEKKKIGQTKTELLDLAINDTFVEPFKKFPLAIKRLGKFENDPRAIKAIEALENFLEAAGELVAMEA